jgi:acyl-coenzyme A thioesterase 13
VVIHSIRRRLLVQETCTLKTREHLKLQEKLIFARGANGDATIPDAMINTDRDSDFSLSINERIRAYLVTVVSDPQYNRFNTEPLRHTDFIAANIENKATRFRFHVLDVMCNKCRNLYGGATSTILDNLSSTALFTIGRPGFGDNLRVSRSLLVVFHRRLPLNSTVELICRVVSAGRCLTHLEAFMEIEYGKICDSCIHE